MPTASPTNPFGSSYWNVTRLPVSLGVTRFGPFTAAGYRTPRARCRAPRLDSNAVVPSAELRVYQPLEAFPAHEQAHWERHIVDGGVRLGPLRYRQEVTPSGAGILVPQGP